MVSPLPLGEGQGEGSTVYLPCYDGNGNVCEYSSTDGTLAAHYEYSPFGETIIQSGDMADSFAFQFSTKYWEKEVGLYYYGYRFYAPNVGRWLNRDPIGEAGGLNIFVSVMNGSLFAFDVLGLSSTEAVCRCTAEDRDAAASTATHSATMKTKRTTKRFPDGSFYHPEFGGWICCAVDTGKAYPTRMIEGTAVFVPEAKGYLSMMLNIDTLECNEGDYKMAIYHSHYSGGFSDADTDNDCIYLGIATQNQFWRWCDGKVCLWDPKEKTWRCP